MMATKKDNRYIQKATDDEELFILMGRDSTAPEVVIEWIKLNFRKQPEEKLREAFETAMRLAYSEAKHIVSKKAIDARGAERRVDFKIPKGTTIAERKDGTWKVVAKDIDKQFIAMKAYENQDSPPLRLTLPYPMYPMYQMHGMEVVIVAKYEGDKPGEGKIEIVNAELYDAEHPF